MAMASALDDLIDQPGPVGDELRQQRTDPPLPTELPGDTTKRKVVENKIKAEDLASRDIPSFRNAGGDVSAVTDDTGQALTHYDANSGIAYDSKGNPKAISYDGEKGPPSVKDPFAGLPERTDIKTGNKYLVRPGLPWKYVGQDQAVAASVQQTAEDKAIKAERDLLGRQLTLDEAEHKKLKVEHKRLGEDLSSQVPTLLDPKYADADLPTVKKAIDEHFDSQYAAPEANATGWFNRELTPDAQNLRTGIDSAKAKAYDSAQKFFDLKARGSEITGRIDQSRAQATLNNQQLLAHARGEPGPLDQLPPLEDITGHPPTDQAIAEAKQGKKTYSIGENDTVQFQPGQLAAGLDQAVKDGIIDPKWADEQRAKFSEAEKKYAELEQAAGNQQVLKALLHGVGIGGAFLAGAAPGAKAGALAGAAIPGAGETGLSEAIGAVLGGLATGTVAAFFARKGLQKVAEYNDAVKSLVASAELHPVASGAGEFIAFGASAPRALAKLYKLGTVAGEAVSDLGPAAVRTAQIKVVGRQLGIGALSGATFEGAIRPAFDAARYAAADALGIKHDQFQSPDAKSILSMAALGVLTAGHSVEFADYSAHDVASVLFRARARNDAGIGLDADNPAAVIKAFEAKGINLDSQQAQDATRPLSPQDQHLYNALKEKVGRMERSGAFDDASGIKFKAGSQARIRTLGREGEPIVSAGVEATKSGGEPPTKPGGETPPRLPQGGEPTNERSNIRQQSQIQPAEGGPVSKEQSPAEPAHQTGAGGESVNSNAANTPESGRGSESRKLLNVVAPEGSIPHAPQSNEPHVVSTAVKQNGQLLVGKTWNESHDAILARHGLSETSEENRGYIVQTPAGEQRFAPRSEAHTLAVTAGQIPSGGKGTGTELRSSDLQPVPVQHATPTDAAAHEAATSPTNGETPPTHAQKDAGNYKLGHQTIAGMDISIENPQGSLRAGTNRDGKPWSITMPSHYGYIKGTIGKDKDHVDVFVKPGTPENWSGPVYVVNQKDPGTGKFDEHKAVIGAQNIDDARQMYHAAHEPGWKGEHSIVELSTPQFKEWAYKANKSQPLTQPEQASPPTKSERSKVEKLVLGAMAKHRDTLSNVGHGSVPKVGATLNDSGIQATPDAEGGTVTVDSEKLARVTRGMADRQQSKYIQRAIEEEITHIAALKYIAKNPQARADLVLWGREDDELGRHLSENYGEWYKLDDEQRGHEKLRAILQKRWTGKLTEAAYRFLRQFLQFMRGIYEKLTPRQREIVDNVESILKGGEQHAITTRKQPEGSIGEHTGIPPGGDVSTHQGQIRQEESGQAGGSGLAGERAPAPTPEQGVQRSGGQPTAPGPKTPKVKQAQAPLVSQLESEQKTEKEQLAAREKSVLDEGTKKAMRDAFEGLFAAMPTQHLTGKEKAAVVMLKKGKTVDQIAKMFVMTPQQVETAYDRSLSALPMLASASPRQRTYPSYTTDQLKARLEDSDPVTRAKMEEEIAAREAGLSPVRVTPQLTPAPKLRSGEKQGDIFSGQTEELTLAGESGIDWEARQKTADLAETEKIAAQKTQDEAQGSLFAAKPVPHIEQRAFPQEKLGSFVQLAQQLLKQGVNTPKQLATEITANLDPKARVFSQQLWDAIGIVNPELRGTHDWDSIYAGKKVKPPKKNTSRASRPDGGFSEHPFVQAIVGDFGGIISKSAYKAKFDAEKYDANKSLWDDAPHLADPRHYQVYDPKSGQTPDTVAAGLADMGMLPEGATESDLWRELSKISDSSKRIERQERVETKKANEAEKQAAEDPWAPTIYHDEFLPEDLAADIIPQDDRGSSASLEPDRGDTTAPEQGRADSVQARPGTTGDNGPSDVSPTRGPEHAAESGPLAVDIPSAPHRAESDKLFREPASDLPERAPGSVEPAGGRDISDRGLPADTGRTKIAGEDIVVPTDSGSLADRGGSGGSELGEIKRASPALKPEQAEDVRFIEARLIEQGKPGALLTNGTGTGKTFSGLGVVKRTLDRGAKDIIIIVPSDKIGSDWVSTAKDFFHINDVTQLASTVDNGHGRRVVVTTFANFGQNDSLVKRPWDLVVADESHYLSSSAGGDTTHALDVLRALTWHPEGIYRRVKMLEPEASDGLHALRLYERRNKGQLSGAQREQRRKYQAVIDETEKKVRAEFEAKAPGDRPKVLFQSATPFAYRKSVDYGSGYLFDYPKVESRGYNTPSPFGQFMIENFGYRMRYGKLTEPENAVATGILERRFAERLMREGAVRGRALVVPFDYSRDFVLTESQLGAKIDAIITKMMSEARLRPLAKKIGVSDYLQRRFILESLKAREAVDRIEKHVALGRKVIVFHDYKLGGSLNPLHADIQPGESVTVTDDKGQRQTVHLADAYAELKSNFSDWEDTVQQLNGLQSPLTQFKAAFPDEGLLGIFNGDVSKKERRRIVSAFNEHDGKMKVFLAQRASAQEGISLHDTFGDEPRISIDLGLPARPTSAIQSEGRKYRVGVKSNSVSEYLVTGTNFERWTFAQTIAQRASTAENLAMGEGARALLQSFAQGFNEASLKEPSTEQGKGGKEADVVRERGNPYHNAVALFYTNEKKTSRSKSREGIDYFATPEPLGFKMVEWAAIQPGEKFLEPSAGHGAIARFAPDSTTRHAVEPSNELAGRLALNAPDTEIHNQRFEDFNIVNKFDGIAMNSPWGGKTAMEHLAKAAEKHTRDGSRVVALIPQGPSMDKRFDQWLESDEASVLKLRADILLPSVLFERAGTAAAGRVVVLDRTDAENLPETIRRDLRDETDIKSLFDRLEHMSVPARPAKKAVVPEPEAERETAKGAQGDYTPDQNAERQPLSPEQSLPKPTRDGDFVPAEFNHTKTGEPVFVAKTARFMSKQEFAAARGRAKEFNGYYSNFKGAGAILGFHFKTPEARDGFIGGAEQPALGASAPKFAKDYYEQDVAPVLRNAKATLKEVKDAAVHVFSPTTGVESRAVDAAFKMLGDRNKAAYTVDRTLVGFEKMFDRLARDEQVAFVDRVKRGEAQPTEELQAVADIMRDIDTDSWKQARAAYRQLGFKNDEIPLAWRENHFRVMWKTIPGSDVERKGVPGRGKSPLRGSRGMQLQATLEDMSEGIEMGGVPFSWNPVTNFKMAQADIWKLTTALQMWAWGKDNGFVRFVKGKFAKVPDGMTWLNDAISRVYFPAPQGVVEPGRYAAEQGFGRLLNNYLSRDFIRQAQLGRSLLWLKNSTTSLELALSLFHGVFETLETVGSNVGLGLQKLINRGVLGGDVKAILDGFKDIITAPTSPISGNSLGASIRKAAGDPDKFFATDEGKKLLKVFPRAREMIDDLFAGGWKPTELEQDWKNNSVRAFIDAIGDLKAGTSSNYIGAGLRAFPAFNEILMKPLFDYYIPNLKVAQFFREYDEALRQNERKLANGELTRSALARQVWRFVEDRFGELNYDTLFWNNNFKTAMQLMFRSVTWKLGSVEAFAGAFSGQGREFINAMRERRAPELHRNMAWLFGMFLLTATLGVVISKTLGKKDPQNLTDVVFPQIDQKDPHVRVSIPTYFKDMVHLLHSPTGYVTASMSGWIGRVADLLRNKDYYGVQIRNTDDPATKQALQMGKFVGETLLPFSVRGYKNLSAAQVDSTRKLLATVGVVPAPRYIGQTKAERAASEIMKGQQTEEGITPEQFEVRSDKKRLVSELTHGRPADIAGAIRAGSIKPKEVKELYRRAGMSPLAYSITHMPLEKAERIYSSATPREQMELSAVMAKKRRNASTRGGRTQFQGF